jgi:hypothetical protein
VKRLAALAVLAALAAAGCGGAAKHAPPQPPPPRLPRTLAQAWARQADGVAAALTAGDGCTAQQLSGALQAEVTQAIGERAIPHAFQKQLLATVDDLPGRITCNPAPPDKHPKHEHKHGDQGNGDGGGG